MSGSRAQGVALVGLVGLSLGAGMALAQGPQNPFAGDCNRTATQEDVELAKGAHQTARQFYERAEYAKAIQYWRDVFNLDCNAVGTLLNIANAYEKLGDRQNAIFALEAYIKRNPEAADAQKIKVKIENLKGLLQGQPGPSASASAAPPPPPSGSAAASSSAPIPPPPVKPYGVAPWVTVGVGGAAVVAGGILLPLGLTTIKGLQITDGSSGEGCRPVTPGTNGTGTLSNEPTGEWVCTSKELADQANSAKSQVLIGKIALGVGGAALAGGLVWEFLFNKPVQKAAPASDDKAAGKIHFSPVLGPGVSGATITGSF